MADPIEVLFVALGLPIALVLVATAPLLGILVLFIWIFAIFHLLD